MTSQTPNYHGYRFPPEIISHAVCLYHRAPQQAVGKITEGLSVSNSSSGRRWKLDHAPAVGDPTHMVEFGTGRRAFAREA